MELLPKEFIPELYAKNMGKSTTFLTITHTTLSLLYCVSGQNSGGMDLQFPDSDWPKLQKS
jgi:hypothetical protein